MRYLIRLPLFCCICNLAFGNSTNSNITVAFDPFSTLSGRSIVDIRFTNFVSEDVVLTTNIFSVILTNDNSVKPIIGIGPLLPETTISNKTYCKGVYLTGNFDRSQNYNLTIRLPGESPVMSPISGAPNSNASSSNNPAPWFTYLGNHINFSVLPFDANGNGGLGLQYTFNYNISSYTPINTSSIGYLKFDISSEGEFGVNYGSSNTNSIQDSLTGETDLKYLFNYAVANPITSSNVKTIVYPVGFLISPAGFEWNKEFSLANYTPKFALGGAIPYLDYPAMLWSSMLKLTNSYNSPTLFSGISYVDPIADKITDPQAAKVHARWDTEFIYDLPLLNQVSFRFTWNSYNGIDHVMWKHYYQVGVVYYVSKGSKSANGLFFGYANGEQPPSYTKTGSWRLGYAIQF